jgi:hypothetical protein
MTNKEYERICLDRFLGAIERTPDRVEAPKPPAPDFLIWFRNELIGVEVTQLLPANKGRHDTPQRQASLRQRVMDLARKFYDEKEAHPLHVSADFLDHVPLSDCRVPVLARSMADYLATRNWGFDTYGREVTEPFKYTDKLPELAGFRFMRVPTPDHGAWAPTFSFWCRPAFESDFLPVLARKERKLSKYRTFAPKVWLLVVVENIEAGELISADPSKIAFSVKTAFDCVYALNRVSGKVSIIEVAQSE